MRLTHKKILTLISLTSITLLTNGCVPKNADGTYTSVYSYHPYAKQQQKVIRQSYRTAHVQKSVYTAPIKPFKAIYSKTSIKPIVAVRNTYRTPKQYNLPMVNNIENTAKSLLGTDYQYGANGPYQYDCSSFTKYVFAKQGINLPRVSRDQAQRGQYIQAGQLKKGDLIFFDSKKSTKVSHVGIYLGRGDFIHASSAQDKVTISNLNSNYYSKHFKWGRRVTNNNYAMR